MNKPITQLIEDISKEIAQENYIGTNLVTGHKAAYFKEMALRVAKQVREATIKECLSNLTIDLVEYAKYGGKIINIENLGEEVPTENSQKYYQVNKDMLIDLNTIIL